jgi:protoheme ferro-lyase
VTRGFYPLAFVPEHCETMVELGMEIRELVMDKGLPAYIRVNTVSVGEKYI